MSGGGGGAVGVGVAVGRAQKETASEWPCTDCAGQLSVGGEAAVARRGVVGVGRMTVGSDDVDGWCPP